MSPKAKRKQEIYSTTLSSRGQVVLPSAVRRKLGLRKGMRINIVLGEGNEESLVLRPMRDDAIRKMRGILRDVATEALEVLQEERRKDRERGR